MKNNKGSIWNDWKVIGKNNDTHPTVQCIYCSKTFNRAIPNRMLDHTKNKCLKINNFSEKGQKPFNILSSFVDNLQWYQKEAEYDNNFAQYYLGIFYECGKGVDKDEDEAFKWYKKSAEKGYSKAQYKLGFFLKNGIGTIKDLNQSLYWYQKAAENGDKDAQFNLGEYYKNGDGVDKDLEKSFYWYQKAAENEEDAQFNLGEYHKDGDGVEKDFEKTKNKDNDNLKIDKLLSQKQQIENELLFRPSQEEVKELQKQNQLLNTEEEEEKSHLDLSNKSWKSKKGIEPAFTKEIDIKIKSLIKEYQNYPNLYATVSKKIREDTQQEYSAKRIRNRWINNLDPELCNDPFDESEKSFIAEWVEKQRTPEGTIHWNHLITVMENISGKKYSENKIKNFVYSKKRRSQEK